LVFTQRTRAAALIPNLATPQNSHTPQSSTQLFSSFSILSLKMSLQVQPQTQPLMQQQQQPVQVYPTSVTYQSPPHHSNGSFGSVFVVLAIIVVISAVACCLGRLCNRRSHSHSHSHSQKHAKPQKQHQQQQNHTNFRQKEVDIEFGFDKRIAASKPNGHGAGRGMKPHPHGDMKSFEMKLGHQGKIRPGPWRELSQVLCRQTHLLAGNCFFSIPLCFYLSSMFFSLLLDLQLQYEMYNYLLNSFYALVLILKTKSCVLSAIWICVSKKSVKIEMTQFNDGLIG